MSKQLRKEIYKSMYNLSVKFPEKPSETADLGDEIEYTRQLIENVSKEIADSEETKIKNLYHRIKELLESE